MKRIAIVFFLLFGTNAHAQPIKEATYFCLEEISGGIAYDASSKKWIGREFATSGKFTLRLKFEKTRTKKIISGNEKVVHDYDVLITPSNTREAARCFIEANSTTPFEGTDFRCHTFQANYSFNLENNRFLLAYLVGYVSGKDDQKTPHIAAGTCTKIN